MNLLEPLDPSIDIIVHCHNKFDLPSVLKVPAGPGIGVTPVAAAIKESRMPGGPY